METTYKTFDVAFDLILRAEGGYVEDKDDPGGATKYGISQRAYPDLNIREMTEWQAKDIFKHDYWLRCRCDELPSPLAIAVGDCAFNQGVGTAIQILQDCVGVIVDGKLGPQTLAAINSKDPQELCALFLAKRAMRYAHTTNFEKYGKGWMCRLFKLALKIG